MPCLLVGLALFAPRLVLALTYLFVPTLSRGFSSILWPLAGFFIAPLTTLAYGLVVGAQGSVTGVGFLLTTFALLLDLGVIGGGVKNRATLRQPLA